MQTFINCNIFKESWKDNKRSGQFYKFIIFNNYKHLTPYKTGRGIAKYYLQLNKKVKNSATIHYREKSKHYNLFPVFPGSSP